MQANLAQILVIAAFCLGFFGFALFLIGFLSKMLRTGEVINWQLAKHDDASIERRFAYIGASLILLAIRFAFVAALLQQ
jgi:hypothetical protein